MAYADLSTIQATDPGDVLTAAWCDQVRDNGEFFVDPPACSIRESTAQSVNSSTWTALTSDEENFDNDAMHSTASNTSRITIQTSGRYLLFATVEIAASAAGSVRACRFLVDGTTAYDGLNVERVNSAATFRTVVSIVRAIPLAAAQFVECQVFHTVGSAHNCTLIEFGATFLTR